MSQIIIIWMAVFILLHFLPCYLSRLNRPVLDWEGVEGFLFFSFLIFRFFKKVFFRNFSPNSVDPYKIPVSRSRISRVLWQKWSSVSDFGHWNFEFYFPFLYGHAHLSVCCSSHVFYHLPERKWRRTVYWLWQSAVLM